MCSEKFGWDEDEQLIELVHANSCLWNMSDPDFKKEKRYIWAEIGRKLTRRPRTGAECKSRWRSIRDYYKKQKKDEKNGSLQVPAIKRRQVYWNSLKFLDDADDELNAFSNVQVEISEDGEKFDFIDCQNPESKHCESAFINVSRKRRRLDIEEPNGSTGDQELQIEHARTMNGNEFCGQIEETVELDTNMLECQLRTSLDDIGEPRKAQDQEIKSVASEYDGLDDDIDLFFKAMAATVKKFSPKLKVESKAKIFTVVNELETRHLESSVHPQHPRNMGNQEEF